MEAEVARLSDLVDGAVTAVKVPGRPLLLVRLGEEVHALPARCTHHPRPLAHGLLHDGRLICPVHQAAFDIRTGDTLEPPALDALAKFPVRIADGRVFVEVPDGASDRRLMAMASFDPDRDRRTFVIIGGGGAGAVAAESLRQAGYQGHILLIGREPHLPYERPHCSEDYLIGKLEESQLPLRSRAFYEEHGIELRSGHVLRFDAPTRGILLDSGESLSADAVLIATGGEPNKIPVPGTHLDGIHTLRCRDDVEAIATDLKSAKAAVIVGAGFVGLETAAGFRRLGLEVAVVAPEPIPLAPALGTRVGSLVQATHEERGACFFMGHTVAEFRGTDHVRSAVLDDGRVLAADLVVIGTGVRPATSFVNGLGLASDGGILVDDRLRAAPGVWAAGDVATYPDPYSGQRVRIEHWRTAQQHGKAAAFSMAGRGAPFAGVPFFWTDQHGLSMAFVGCLRGWDDVVFHGDVEQRDFLAFYLAGDRLLGAGGTRRSQLSAFAELMRQHILPSAHTVRTADDLDLVGVLSAST